MWQAAGPPALILVKAGAAGCRRLESLALSGNAVRKHDGFQTGVKSYVAADPPRRGIVVTPKRILVRADALERVPRGATRQIRFEPPVRSRCNRH
jgi:hypothetical protein